MERVPLPRIRFNAVIGVGDVIAIRGLRDGESAHTINLLDSTTHTFKELRFPTIQIAAHKNNLAVLTMNSVILFDLATNTTIREISIPGRLPLGNILTTDDFIFVLSTNGITSAFSIFVIDLHRDVITERVLTVRPMENVQMVVVGKYAVFTGGVATQTQPLEVFDMVSLEWKFILLPRTLFTRSISLLAIGNRVFVGRSLTIDAVDVASGTAATLPFPVAEISKMVSVGSKLVVHSVAAASAVVTITMYEVTTGDWTSMTIPTLVTSLVETVSNYIVVYIGQVLRANPFVMPLSTMLEGFDSRELFIGQTTNLAVTAAGPELTYRWYHDGQVLPDSSSSVLLDNITMSSDGEYRVDVIDHCHLHIVHEARVTVHDKPAFNIPLRDSVTLCHGTEELIVDSEGVAVEYKWTIDGATVVDASESHLNLTINNIPCNTRALVCAIAFNPSGPSQSCAGVRMLELDSVIKGPLPTISPSTWFSESVAELRVEVLEGDCTSHTWIIDGVAGTKYEAQSSTLSVELSPAMARTQFYVRLKCGNSVIKSRTFSFEQVSALPVYGVVLIVVGLVTGVAIFVVVIFFLRKRLSQSQVKEVELSTLLSNAKTDSIKKESIPIINKTTWEWTPTEDFSYKSLDSLPIIVDTSQLKFSERGEPLEAEMNYNKELTLSSRSQKKAKKATILTERLITDMKIDIYAPKSPKYQVIVEPETLYLESGASYSVTVSVRMNMTTKCNVVLIVVLEQQKIYSAIEFKLESKMSTWIDLEEIQMSGEFLGGGGFGSVIRGVYRGQDVAVKKLLSQYLTPDMMIEFEREVTLMKSLRHPNIVQFIGASNVKESLAIVIEFAPLGSLASVMEKQQLSQQFKVMCLLETAKALQFLHSNGVIHRDIKPQNILVFSLEHKSPVHVKLTDFGTSRFISDDPTTITKNVGTISFMAPEALGHKPRINKSADVYSFAVLMWSVLFEQTPFQEFKWDSDIEQHVKSGNRLPFPHGHDVDVALVKLIEECWHNDPSQRPSINVVVQRLSNIKS